MLVSCLLEPIAFFLHKRYKPYCYLEWCANSTLQLQRLAYEEARLGTWSECTQLIPTTRPDELLGSLDITDLKHPVLQKSYEKYGSSTQSVTTQTQPENSIKIRGDEAQGVSPVDVTTQADDAHISPTTYPRPLTV